MLDFKKNRANSHPPDSPLGWVKHVFQLLAWFKSIDYMICNLQFHSWANKPSPIFTSRSWNQFREKQKHFVSRTDHLIMYLPLSGDSEDMMQFQSLNLARCSNPRDEQRIRDAIAGAEDEVSHGPCRPCTVRYVCHGNHWVNSKVFRRLTFFCPNVSWQFSYVQLVARWEFICRFHWRKFLIFHLEVFGGGVRNVSCEKIVHLLWLVFDDACFWNSCLSNIYCKESLSI